MLGSAIRKVVPVLFWYSQFSAKRTFASRPPCFLAIQYKTGHAGIVQSTKSSSSSSSLYSSDTSNSDDDDDDDVMTESVPRQQSVVSSSQQQLHRADKVLATRTQYSRSQAFDLLQKHRVTMGDDNSCKSLPGPSVKIPMNAALFLDGKSIPPLPPDLFVFYKPKGVLSAMIPSSKPKQNIRALEEKVSTATTTTSNRDHLGNHLPPHLKKLGMHPVGRLDYDTSGLILFSKDGQVTHRLLHPNFEVEREYVASVVPDTEYSSRIIPLESLKEQVETLGIPILLRDRSDSTVKTSFVCFGQVLNINQGDDDDDLIHVRLIVKEGKHRMVRRMLAYCGYTVVELHRERHGAFELKDLKSGQFRPATETEIAWVQSLE